MSFSRSVSDGRDPDEESGRRHSVSIQKQDAREGQGSHNETAAPDPSAASLGSRKALVAYLILCFSTGPTSSMVYNYVSAAIQSAANLVGHQPGSDKPCARRGSSITCLVRFGAGEIDYLSYLLYLRAIGRAMEGILTIFTAGMADYSYYRKAMMIGAIILFGGLALPFAALTKSTYPYLVALSVLYCCLTTIQGVYAVIESSYIPIFMRSAGWFRSSPVVSVTTPAERSSVEKQTWTKGVTVSVLALVSGNVGSLVALIIGVILVYTRGSYVQVGYHNYLLAITIAGSLTIVFALIGNWLLPSIPGQPKPKGENVFHLMIKGWVSMFSSVRRYPEAFKLCIGWVLWNTAYSNYNSLIQALFLEVTGISNGSGVYQVWSFTAVLCASLGSLSFLFIFPRVKIPVKRWAYVFLSVNFLCLLWGCIGINPNVPIGFKNQPEFWVEQVLFLSTSSALRSYNRAVYSSLIPKGSEAQFFGLEITLDLAIGWINPLVQGVIQNRTHNLRFPMLPNIFLMVIAIFLYFKVDIDKGIEDAKVPLRG
ncbi:hypothetical protein CPC735_048850 [Coccidioides posadasii C735 delta SOWgp]|uniref:Autophagy-related protein n=2 Tax=Coccidioides posadasii TaxID=199306 RepID=A0A0J6F416_COCPO|nr:hypothetical protein CPC735_048850 [Coccidioides posadasii C735 delta SOWgp]EER23515.1 hypothetical protein CPC735_048850 [Coccidioides posadasii C735 delta SOWgp]KMM64903.1 hypothetical protein CPAG_01255 [Coccidioides posadasii RMSCC 3488]|eukprot:XP_003065660.1 hypothetical protein CPC735_048850 [Coccidioides posadasii C735 delta SOWgp]